MRAFAALLESLVLTPSRNRKMDLLVRYFADNADPDRGYGLAAITRDLDLPTVKAGLIRQLAVERVDEELFRLSYDYVGDLAETVALIWPQHGMADGGSAHIRLGEIVERLGTATKAQAPALMRDLLDTLDQSQRYALIKLATGGLRVGVSARFAKQALANFGKVDVGEIEELWHGLAPPFADLFAWLEGKAEKPVSAAAAPFRPVMLAHGLEARDHELIDPASHLAEWKWDGIRVQAVSEAGVRRIFSRTGDDISAAFPDVLAAMDFEGVIDGELLVGDPARGVDGTGTFSDLQQRLNRKTVSRKLLASHPAFIRAYDLLVREGQDLRDRALSERKAALRQFLDGSEPSRFDISPVIDFASMDELQVLRAEPPHPVIEGIMLKRKDSLYVAGRPKGPWFKWKRDPFTVDAVLMYAQRGHGKRSGFYSDFTFGVWRDETLVPVGKAYFGFTDEELKQLDKFVRENTVERFGPVRSVRADRQGGLVLEIAFEGLNRSSRHKSGVAMRFPRIARIRWDKPTTEADRLESLEALL